jgi:hypothetical protein
MKKVLFVLAGVVLLSVQGYATGLCISNPDCLISVSGNFTAAGPSGMASSTFLLSRASDVLLRTWSFAGGTNLNGDVIPAGGFDPILTLYRNDSTHAFVAQNDDGGCTVVGSSGGLCWDSYMRMNLAAGPYAVVLSVYNNFPTGNFYPTAAGSPSFYGRTSEWSMEVSQVPEPVTMALFGSGLLALGLARRFRRRA